MISNRPKFVFAFLAAGVLAAHIIPGTDAAEKQQEKVPGYINHIPAESRAQRYQRHALVQQRRSGTVLMVHRGASGMAPENTLEAYHAAMVRGADGNEIDIHSTSDGVLVLHHDDTLGRTVEGPGRIRDLTYCEILQRKVKGGSPQTRMPTLASLLELARKTGMLLHLDIKQEGLEDKISSMLTRADMWDHVVLINPGPASDRIRFDKRLSLMDYKGWFHEAGTSEESRKAFMERPNQMIFTKSDPREAAEYLGRKVPAEEEALPGGLRAWWRLDNCRQLR